MFTIATFYKCLMLDTDEVKHSLEAFKLQTDIVGTIILTPEGINSTVASKNLESLKDLKDSLERHTGELCFRFSNSSRKPFKRFKLKERTELVPSGTSLKAYDFEGKYLNPKQWNDLIKEKNSLIVDVRNIYETKVGSFKNSLSPETKNFREFKDFVDSNLDLLKRKKLGIFCTGGIRCEKASAILNEKGVENTYQLEGGILNYLDSDIDKENWIGECFVFDERVTVDKKLDPGIFIQCFACRRPLSPEDIKHKDYVKGISCLYCINEKSEFDRKRYRDRQRQFEIK